MSAAVIDEAKKGRFNQGLNYVQAYFNDSLVEARVWVVDKILDITTVYIP